MTSVVIHLKITALRQSKPNRRGEEAIQHAIHHLGGAANKKSLDLFRCITEKYQHWQHL